MSIVEAIASNIAGSGRIPPCIGFDDLVSWGIEGLIKAHRNYKSDKGSQFKTYAFYRIRGEILDRIRSEWQYRNPHEYTDYRKKLQDRIAEIAEEALEDPALAENSAAAYEEAVQSIVANSAISCLISSDSIDIESHMAGTRNPETEFFEEEEASYRLLWSEINTLDAEEKELVELFYVKGLKQKEIAAKLNFSNSKVCRLHMKILDKLRRRMSKKMTEPQA